MRRLAFWGAAATIVYGYVLFPLLILVRARLRPRPPAAADIEPDVTIIVPAYNEAATIGAKLDNLAALDYPAQAVEILVASDGSTDATAAIVRRRARPGLRLLDLPRGGKAATLEAAVSAARGDIVVMTDANSMFAPGALRALVRPFADPEVGGVAGNQVYLRGGVTEATAAGERGYWDFDRLLKRAESAAGNVIGTTGAIYAIRRELFRPLRPDVSDDFYTSLAVIDQGRRLVFVEEAVASEPVMATRALEFRRKVRVMTRGLRCVVAMPQLLDPRRTGFYALQLASHKIVMRLMAVPLAVLAGASLSLLGQGWIYRFTATGQAACYALAAAGLALARRPLGRRPFLAFPAYFVLVNAAALRATWDVVRGRRIDRWEPPRTRQVAAHLHPLPAAGAERKPAVARAGDPGSTAEATETAEVEEASA
ncbi:MAG TPA: glycosyltransferase family 2 protein [Candidatus Limnocylindrales bacterium]|nr:glycosyltransferase family 2 protein [Candidatus Limnocylindrales bacterium]